MRLFVMAALFGLSLQSFAFEAFRPYTRNEDLAEQLKDNPKRVLPPSELYSVAADFRIWKYWPASPDYYHGPGYWADAFVEVRPYSNLTINGQLHLLNGSTSFGYVQSQAIQNLFGVTWYPDFWGEQKVWRMRFFDMGRQTLGTGLVVQDLEMSGLETSFKWDDNVVRFLFPGTGVLRVEGDLLAMEAEKKWRESRLGLNVFFINNHVREENYDSAKGAWDYSSGRWGPQSSLYYTQDFGVIEADLEAGWRNSAAAGKLRLGADFGNEIWSVRPQLQGRYYTKEYLGDIAGAAQYDFTPYNLVDRIYDNPMNFLRFPLARSPVRVASAEIMLRYWINDRYKLEAHGEHGQFNYDNVNPTENYSWGKAAWGFCPYAKARENCISLYGTNYNLRLTSVNISTPPTRPIRRDEANFGIEAFFYL